MPFYGLRSVNMMLCILAGWIHGFLRMTIKKLRNPILHSDIDIYIWISICYLLSEDVFLWLHFHSGDSSVSVIGAIEPIKPITAITSTIVANNTFLEFYPFLIICVYNK